MKADSVDDAPAEGVEDQAWDWAVERRDLRPATRGGDVGPEKKDPGGTPFLVHVRRKRSWLRQARTAAKERRGSTSAHPANNLQEEHALDADLIATPALFVSTEMILTSQE
ncbi:hypothetical protein NDU88_003801 [Pleurodeles waltl]|uniref:Uncharacterized protein n=1 Tax=Pleurodeles waltl TaxID=8319 RepID=A0AAV7N156_PLEWA|nr:hypothetical protein NDU88_003801 [Pleurodeles waltl]